jgi:hypothetical protein
LRFKRFSMAAPPIAGTSVCPMRRRGQGALTGNYP